MPVVTVWTVSAPPCRKVTVDVPPTVVMALDWATSTPLFVAVMMLMLAVCPIFNVAWVDHGDRDAVGDHIVRHGVLGVDGAHDALDRGVLG